MKNLIKYFLNKLGYKIVRINPIKKIKIHTLTHQKPLFIEFIGVSGVGKSTLYKAMIKQRASDDNWLGVKEYINYINGNIWPLDKDIHPVYKKILNKKYEQVTRKYNIKDTIGFMAFFLKNIKEEIIARHSNQKYTLVIEEGLFHNFGSAIMELHQKNEIDLNSLIKNRALVFCYATPEIISKELLRDTKP